MPRHLQPLQKQSLQIKLKQVTSVSLWKLTLQHKWVQLCHSVALQGQAAQARRMCQASRQALQQASVGVQLCQARLLRAKLCWQRCQWVVAKVELGQVWDASYRITWLGESARHTLYNSLSYSCMILGSTCMHTEDSTRAADFVMSTSSLPVCKLAADSSCCQLGSKIVKARRPSWRHAYNADTHGCAPQAVRV